MKNLQLQPYKKAIGIYETPYDCKELEEIGKGLLQNSQ